MKKILLIICVLTLLFFLGCQKSVAPEDDGTKKSLKIGGAFQEMNNPYFIVMKEAAESAANQLGAQLFISDAQHDIVKQIADVEDMIRKGVDILIVNPTDTEGIKNAVINAKKAGVVVVAVDADAAGPRDSYVTSKNYDAGYIAGKSLGEKLNGKGEIAIIDGIPTDGILARLRGFRDAMKEFPAIKEVTLLNGKQNREEALSVMENILTAHPNLNGVFTVNDEGSLGAYSAILASGKEVYVTSVDGNPEAVEAIASGGLFLSTAAQHPRDMVRIGLGMALAKYWGAAKLPHTLPIDVELIDASNAKSFSW